MCDKTYIRRGKMGHRNYSVSLWAYRKSVTRDDRPGQAGMSVTLFRFLVTLFRFLSHTFLVFGSHFSGFWVTLFRFLGHTFIVPIVPGHTFPVCPRFVDITRSTE